MKIEPKMFSQIFCMLFLLPFYYSVYSFRLVECHDDDDVSDDGNTLVSVRVKIHSITIPFWSIIK